LVINLKRIGDFIDIYIVRNGSKKDRFHNKTGGLVAVLAWWKFSCDCLNLFNEFSDEGARIVKIEN